MLELEVAKYVDPSLHFYVKRIEFLDLSISLKKMDVRRLHSQRNEMNLK
ncbi:hypothetical protein RS030_182756, partial [Cryptosporidium xiaoi]